MSWYKLTCRHGIGYRFGLDIKYVEIRGKEQKVQVSNHMDHWSKYFNSVKITSKQVKKPSKEWLRKEINNMDKNIQRKKERIEEYNKLLKK